MSNITIVMWAKLAQRKRIGQDVLAADDGAKVREGPLERALGDLGRQHGAHDAPAAAAGMPGTITPLRSRFSIEASRASLIASSG